MNAADADPELLALAQNGGFAPTQAGKERVAVDLLKPRQCRVLVVREDQVGPPCEAAQCGTGKKGAGFTLMLPAYHNDLLEGLTRTGGFPRPCAKREAINPRGDPG